MKRIVGLETEYGCLMDPVLDSRAIANAIRDWVFENNRYGLIDIHDRDWDEPAGNGGFLFNGGRLYLDMGHVEYCTPECGTALDLVHYDQAGDRLLLEAVRDLGLKGKVHFIRNNIDHYTGATFGCHENYSLSRRAPLDERNVLSLLTFLTLRVLLSGAGRVGSAKFRGERGLQEPSTPFQISQRADHIQNDFYEWVQHNRAIINTRDEPLGDPRKYRRLHLLHGDTNVLPSALFLKAGSTRLVLDLLEENELPPYELRDAVRSMRQLSRTLRAPWKVTLGDGSERDALEILSLYREKASSRYAGRDEETDAVLALWLRVEEGLLSGPESLVGVVDWITKEHLLSEFARSEGLSWEHPWMEAQDLEYHHVEPERCLAMPLADLDGYWSRPPGRDTLQESPRETRAHIRGKLMRQIVSRGSRYMLDWEGVVEEEGDTVVLLDPFQS